LRVTAAPLAKTLDLQDFNGAVERKRDHRAGLYGKSWRGNALAVEADVAGRHQRRRSAAGAHQAGMPKPFVDALTVEVIALRA
jgi:hypothetical protein